MISFKKIKNQLIELFYGKCQFHEDCELYQHDHYICNQEAGPYCGKWRELINKE